MFDLTFNSPWYLLLLLLAPVMWVLSFRSLAGLGRVRRIVAIGLRTLVLVLIVLSLADAQRKLTSDRLTVIYLLDQSESIPIEKRAAMLGYVTSEVTKHRDSVRRDRAGLIIFGRDAAIEVAPFEADLAVAGQLEAMFDMRTDATNLAAALRLARATFPEDSARRVVIVTDGNENLGDARAVARMLAADGVGVDVVPIELESRSEVAVDKVTLPEDIRKGQPIEARIVVTNMTQPTAEDSGRVEGSLRLIRRYGNHEETLSDLPVDLPPGKSVFHFPAHEIDQPDFYTYEAKFEPKNPGDDLMRQNNRATAFTHVRGQGHVLVVEDWDESRRGEFDMLVDRLKVMNIAVTRRSSDQPFSSLAELQRYDCVILANCPRSSGDDVTRVTSFSDDQIEMLVRNTQQMGGGLIMIGGERGFGAGGWAGTELEKAMPVDFTIKNKKVQGVSALVLLMHACEIPQGNYWEQVVAREAIKGLGPMDYCGLVYWGGSGDAWLWKDNTGNGLMRVGENRQRMLGRLGRMVPGDMPTFDPAMQMALKAFNNLGNKAAVKHMIIVSDGDPSPSSWKTREGFRTAPPKGIQITTVAVGGHGPAGHSELQKIATHTGGKYYVVRNARALPRIYQREVRRIARPLVFEKPVQPRVVADHEMLNGIDEETLPTIKGFVLTTTKDNPLVETSVISPNPPDARNSTVLASWTYGLGRSVAPTTDAGDRWATKWKTWDKYDLLFSQMVRWAMRPPEEEGKFRVATEVEDGKVRVVVTALDTENEFLNFLNIAATATTPDMQSADVAMKQVAPGRYVGEFDADESGSYFLSFAGKAPSGGEGEDAGKMRPFQFRTGVSVPYSDEFRNRETNLGLLTMLAELKPTGGEPGEVIRGPMSQDGLPDLTQVDTFRHNLAKAVSSREIWPMLLLIASCLFFADVFVRRVTVDLSWTAPVAAPVRDVILRRDPAPVKDERLERLRSRKEQVHASLDDRRAAARFEPESQADLDADVIAAELSGARAAPPPSETGGRPQIEPDEEEDTYTSRLLKAKKDALKGKDARKTRGDGNDE